MYRFFLGIALILLNLIFANASLAALPDLGGGGSAALSPEEDQALGQRFFSAVRKQLPLFQDPIVNDYVQQLGFKLASHSPRPDLPFHFFIVRSSQLNAFAGPGGYIGINSGLILSADNKTELAGVMAHEIAHVTQRHLARSLAHQRQLMLPTMGALLASILISTQSSQAGLGAMTAAQSAYAQDMLHFSRQYEREADQVGMEIMEKAGFNTAGMTTFLRKLLAQHYTGTESEAVLNELSTHPSTSSRIAELFNPENSGHIPKASLNYDLIRARVAADTTGDFQAAFQHYKTILNQTSLNKNTRSALRYAYILLLDESDSHKQALSECKLLASHYPDNLWIQMTYAKLLHQQNHTGDSLSILKSLYQRYPEYMPLVVQYAKTLSQNGQSQQALHLLTNFNGSAYNNVFFLHALMQTQHHAGEFTAAYQTQADIFLINNEPEKAEAVLQTALHHAKNPIDRAKIKRLLKGIDEKKNRNPHLKQHTY